MIAQKTGQWLPRAAAVMASAVLAVSSIVPTSTAHAQTTTPPRASLDVTGNGVINDADAATLIDGWLAAQEQGQCTPDGLGTYDFTKNGCLDVADIQQVVAAWGESADPAQPVPDVDAISASAVNEFVVNSAGDEVDAAPGDGACATAVGTCTLRAAIQESNSRAGSDRISFQIGCPASTAPIVIQPTSTATTGLVLDDAAKQGTEIDGYTQCGAAPNNQATAGNAKIRIEIKGKAKDLSAPSEQVKGVYGLTIRSPGNLVRGLSLYHWDISLFIAGESARNNRVEGNFIGLNVAQNTKTESADMDRFDNGGGDALRLQNRADGNLIGGVAPDQRNIITGGWDGLSMEYRTYNTQVYNNYVGLKQDGQTQFGNASDGIDINLGSAGNIIGGTAAGQRNVISGNFSDGLEVSHSPYIDDAFGDQFETKSNKVIGNYIGPSATGGTIKKAASAKGANSASGISLEDNVEGTEVGHNVISDNGNDGIRMWSRISNAHIHDNKIGVAPDGVTAMANGLNIDPKDVRKGHHGIYMLGDSDHNLIANNIIANNKGYGVLISNGRTEYAKGEDPNNPADDLEFGKTDYNTLRQNSIYGNGDWDYLAPSGFTDTSVHKGIRLKEHDGDEPNLGMPRPTITKAYSNVVNGTATVAGGGPCAGCVIEVFVADATTDYGEGQTFIGGTTTLSNGSFALPISGRPAGTIITATVTDSNGNTSEFARNVAVEATAGPSPSPAPSPPPPKPVPTDKLYLPLIRRS